MTPSPFKQQNVKFLPPPSFDVSQVAPVDAFRGVVEGGNVDGQKVVIVCWIPSDEDRERIMTGAPIYMTQFGGQLSPHCLTTYFPENAKG